MDFEGNFFRVKILIPKAMSFLNDLKSRLSRIDGVMLSEVKNDLSKISLRITLPNGNLYGLLYLTPGWSFLPSGTTEPHTVFLERNLSVVSRYLVQNGNIMNQICHDLQAQLEDSCSEVKRQEVIDPRRETATCYLLHLKDLIGRSRNEQLCDDDGSADVSQVHEVGTTFHVCIINCKAPYAIGKISVCLDDVPSCGKEPTHVSLKVDLQSQCNPERILANDADTVLSKLCDAFNALNTQTISHEEISRQYAQSGSVDVSV